jgi:hypothetical protein
LNRRERLPSSSKSPQFTYCSFVFGKSVALPYGAQTASMTWAAKTKDNNRATAETR